MATGGDARALDALASYVGTNAMTLERMSRQQLVEEVIALRMTAYGACREEDGEYMSFLDPRTGEVGAARCVFDSEQSELKARASHSSGMSYHTSASHPCYEEEGNAGTLFVLAVLFFFLVISVMNCSQLITQSTETGRAYGANVAKVFMASNAMS